MLEFSSRARLKQRPPDSTPESSTRLREGSVLRNRSEHVGPNIWPAEFVHAEGRTQMIDFKLETELLADETVVVSVGGELDLHTAPPFEDRILGALENGHARIVIDLTGCEFLDSTALGILVTARKRLGEHKDRLVLVAADRNIVKIFELTGLDRTFTIAPTRESALNGATRG